MAPDRPADAGTHVAGTHVAGTPLAGVPSALRPPAGVGVPTPFVGAWERRSLALGDGPPTEPARVIWVQGHAAYADLRVPRGRGTVECFAGFTRWDPPHLHWSHEVDLAGGPAAQADLGRVEWVDGDLVERGTFTIDGEAVPYVEVWRRLPGSDGPVVEVPDRGRWRVEVGEHELVVADRRATGGAFGAWYRRGGRLELRLPSAAAPH